MKRKIIEMKNTENNLYQPRIGVVSQHSLDDWFYDDVPNGESVIDITFESWYEDRKQELFEEIKEQVDTTDEEIEDAVDERMEKECDDYFADETTYLIGDWVKDKNGVYQIDRNGKNGFAAIYSTHTGNVCVEYSKYVMINARDTSPCYIQADDGKPCGDLDSEGNLEAYSFPSDYYWEEI